MMFELQEENASENEKRFSPDEKKKIMAKLHERRRQEQKSKEALQRYLSDKKIYNYQGREYYKIKDYKNSFYISKEVMDSLAETVVEVELERSGYTANRKQKGFIKWDPVRQSIMASLSNVRVYYKPFEVE